MPSLGLKQWFPHLPSALDRAPMAGLMCAGALLLGVALAGARSNSEEQNANSDAPKSAAATARYHEGDELVEQSGRFKRNGDQLVFCTSAGDSQLVVLQNRTLDRVANDLVGNASLIWTVSGKITEYRGSNYLLLTRAQHKSGTAAPIAKP
jgi:hypothetical protein